MTPLARSINLLRSQGWLVGIVESWLPIPGKKIRRDLFSFGDLAAAHPKEKRISLIQATTVPNVGARVSKIKSRPAAAIWLQSGGEIVVHGWCRRGGRWCCKVVAITLDDMGELETAVVAKPPRKRRVSLCQGTLWP